MTDTRNLLAVIRRAHELGTDEPLLRVAADQLRRLTAAGDLLIELIETSRTEIVADADWDHAIGHWKATRG